jgi:hypothetical protein
MSSNEKVMGEIRNRKEKKKKKKWSQTEQAHPAQPIKQPVAFLFFSLPSSYFSWASFIFLAQLERLSEVVFLLQLSSQTTREITAMVLLVASFSPVIVAIVSIRL